MDTALRKLYPWFAVLGLVIGVLVVTAFYKDQHREWKDWQHNYVKDEIARAATPEQRADAARTHLEIRQIVLPELDRADRCNSCHFSISDPRDAVDQLPGAYRPDHVRHP